MAKKANHFWIEPDELSRKGIDFCSLEAQGLWLKVMRLLHASDRYGYLSRDGKAVSDEQAARRCGLDVQTWLSLVTELTDFDLLKRSNDGILFSPELIAQAEWRSAGAKRQKDFQDKKRGEKYNGTNNGQYNADITPDITPNSQPNFKPLKPSSFPNGKKEGGGSANTRVKPPPAADSSFQNRQWIELTAEEKQMETEDFLTHLQKLYPKQNVRKIGKKLKGWCEEKQKDFCLERLKGWVFGEGSNLSESEFSELFGNETEGYKNPLTGRDLK